MKNIWKNILKTAIHIPSPHNVQPWLVKIVDEQNAELYIDSKRTLPKEDITGSFIILTMGMFIEAISILAERKGFRLSYKLFHEPDWYAPAILEHTQHTFIPFAKLKLSSCKIIDNSYDEKIFLKRRTSRLNLKNITVPTGALKNLKRIANDWQQNLSITTDAKQIERIMEWNTQALFEDLNNPDYRDEIAEWFRYSNKSSNKHRDGLDYRSMNTPRLTFWMSAKMSFLMKTPILKHVLAKVYRSQLGKIPTLGIIAGGFWKPADSIEAGKFLIRFWLETATHDLYIHPFGNLVTNKKIAKLVENELKVPNIWLVFKIGFSDEPPKSQRLPLEKIIIQ